MRFVHMSGMGADILKTLSRAGVVLCLCASVVGPPASAQQVDCHAFVRQGAHPQKADGSSWETAFVDLDAALRFVDSPQIDTNVCIAAGVYSPAASTYDLRDHVHLYGGFAGTEPATVDLSERKPSVHKTILDGTGRSDHVLMCGGSRCEGPIVLDGFTVRGGDAGRYGSPALSGGGLYNAIGELKLSNIVFSANAAQHQGGAAFNVAGTLEMSNVIVEGNSAEREGGGIYNHAGRLAFSNVVFVGNTSGVGGAGIYTLGKTEVSNSLFFGNNAPYGSAAVGGHWFVLTNSIVWSNRVGQGAQLFVNPALAKVVYSIVEDNGTANNSAYAGLSNSGADPRFIDAGDPDGPDDTWGTADDGLMLRDDSPAIDAGTRDGVHLTDRDLLGNPRIRGSSVDTGPYEHDPTVSTATDVDEVIDGFVLSQNYPNPFNPETQITFSMPAASRARLAVYDLLGHEVAVLIDAVLPAGSHDVRFDAARLPSGVYSYVLHAGDRLLHRKMVVAK